LSDVLASAPVIDSVLLVVNAEPPPPVEENDSDGCQITTRGGGHVWLALIGVMIAIQRSLARRRR
jgi:hypothetical protein